MVSDCPGLRDLVGKTKDRRGKDTTLEVIFEGGGIAFMSAGTPNDLAMRPIGLLIFDESKSYDAISEGSPKEIARARLRASPDAKELDVTSPHLKASPLHDEWMQSDQRYFQVPCPHCSKTQRLAWREANDAGEFYGVVWDSFVDRETDKRTHLPGTARYRCQHCLLDWDDGQRKKAVQKGYWEPSNPRGTFPGFHISALYSLLIKGLHKPVEEFIACGKDPEKLMVFFNTWLWHFHIWIIFCFLI